MKSCIRFKEGDGNGGKSQQLQFNYYCWIFIILLNCACRDFNVRLQLCAVIKFRAKLKAAQLANFPLMSRHMIVCRDILKLWEDKLSSGRDIRHFMTLLSCRDHTTLLKELLVANQMFCRDLNFCHDITFGRDLTLVLPSVLTK